MWDVNAESLASAPWWAIGSVVLLVFNQIFILVLIFVLSMRLTRLGHRMDDISHESKKCLESSDAGAHSP